MFDSFRILNKDKREYTYERLIQNTTTTTKSKLDYIYTDQETTSYNLTKAIIKDTRELLGTDYKVSYALLNVMEWTEHRALNRWKSDHDKQLHKWDFKRTRSKDWIKFGEVFKSMLLISQLNKNEFLTKQEYIEEILLQLEETITMIAEMALPKIKWERNKVTFPKIRHSDNPLVINFLHLIRIR